MEIWLFGEGRNKEYEILMECKSICFAEAVRFFIYFLCWNEKKA